MDSDAERASENLPTPMLWASVIVVNYNGGQRLLDCLASLLPSCGSDTEIILVDNASTDGSGLAAAQAFPGIRFIANSHNQGFGAANNQAAGIARGRYLAFLNPDTLVESGWLAALIAALEADPQAGLATARILLLDDPSRINTCGNDIHCTGLTLCRGLGLTHDALDCPAEVGAVSGAAFVLRRDLFMQLGGFDARFFLYVEDTDLSWRARLAGYRCIYVPSSVVLHDYTLRVGPQKIYYQERNRYLMLLKTLRWPTFLVLAPALLLAELIAWGFVLLHDRKHMANKVRAYAWILRHWRWVMAQRREVQAQRRVHDYTLLRACTSRLAFAQTGSGWLVVLADSCFNPIFLVLQRLALALIRW